MSMLRNYEVCFTVYTNDAKTIGDANLYGVRTIIAAQYPSQAEAMIKAQYGSRVQINSVMEVR